MTLSNIDGEKRYHMIGAEGGDYVLTATGVLHGFGGRSGVMVRDGEKLMLGYQRISGADVITVEGASGDLDQEVTLAPALNEITLTAAAIPSKFRTPPLSGNLTITAGELTGQEIRGRIGPATGAERTVTLAGWHQTYGASGGSFALASGETALIAAEQQGTDRIIRLLGVSDAATDIQVVDFTSWTVAGGSGSETKSLPSMQPGDTLLIVAARTAAVRFVDIVTGGYTSVLDSAGTGPGRMAALKQQSGKPDTTIEINRRSGATYAWVAAVLRGVDESTPQDAVRTTTTGSSGLPDAPSITTVTDRAAAIAVGALEDDDAAAGTTAPSGYEMITAGDTGQGLTTNGATVMMAIKIKDSAGAEDPGAFGGSVGNDNWFSMSVSLRKATA